MKLCIFIMTDILKLLNKWLCKTQMLVRKVLRKNSKRLASQYYTSAVFFAITNCA